MCGIAALLSRFGVLSSTENCVNALGDAENDEISIRSILLGKLLHVLSRRGPDATNQLAFSDQELHLIGTVLHIQGADLTIQPVTTSGSRNSLLWNGEVFGGDLLVEVGTSDTVAVSIALEEMSSKNGSSSKTPFGVKLAEFFSTVHGPFAFVYYHNQSQTIYFGRDSFGRRSLILYFDQSDSVVAVASSAMECLSLSSSITFEEVTVGGIFSLSTQSLNRSSIQQYTWPESRVRLTRHPLQIRQEMLSCTQDQLSDLFLEHVRNAVNARVSRLACLFHDKGEDVIIRRCYIGVLFSGGIDCLLLAAMLHLCLCDPNEPVELINVAFLFSDKDGSVMMAPDRLAAIAGLCELRRLFPTRPWRLVEVDVSADERAECDAWIKTLIQPANTHMDLNIGAAFWFASRGRGKLRQYHEDVKDMLYAQTNEQQRPLLRMGAEGAAKGVGRQKPIKEDGKEEDENGSSFMVTSLSGMFASEEEYCAQCKALLVGIGADEQLAGYGRHRTVFQRGGSEALESELNMDLTRLWQRNLGRDDRCIADHGREAWFPYLDEQFVSFIQSLPLEKIADLSLPQGVGEKMILRQAALKLGLTKSAQLVKRAIQFGTLASKQTSVQYYGSRRRGKGESKI